MPAFGPWEYARDVDATVAAYARTQGGGATTCGCAGCRNFVRARPRVFPDSFLAILGSLGIDPAKDLRVCQHARLAPGRHGYTGSFLFVGDLLRPGPHEYVSVGEGLTVSLSRGGLHGPAPAFEGLAVVILDFHADAVPWVLDEPEID